MEQGNFIIGAISAEEMIKTFVKNGAEVVGDRDYKVVYLKNVNDENDMKGVVYYVDNYFDFDPDFPECPKVQVLIGDPRNKYSFVSSTESAATEVQNFINKGYEEFCYTTSRDIDLYIPETITGTSGRRVTVMDYVVGDEERGDEYLYSIGATVLKDRGCSVHSNCAPWTVEDVEGIIDSVFDGPVIVNPTNREILTAFDILDIIAESEETFEC